MSRFKKIVWWAAGWVIGLAALGMLITGLLLIRSRGGANPGSFVDTHRTWTILIGCLLLAVATMAGLGTMTKDGKPSRWVKALPGLLLLATVNGLIMLSNGHLLNTPSKPIPRVDALLMTLLFFGSAALLSSTIKGGNLNFVDRAALIAFLFSFAWSVLDNSAGGLAVGFCCLVIAWIYDRIQRRRRYDHESRPNHVTV
jgi:hypothetical protein